MLVFLFLCSPPDSGSVCTSTSRTLPPFASLVKEEMAVGPGFEISSQDNYILKEKFDKSFAKS